MIEFKATGIKQLDNLLWAIESASESYHNTNQWHDNGYVDKIQMQADLLAEEISKLESKIVKNTQINKNIGWCIDRGVTDGK